MLKSERYLSLTEYMKKFIFGFLTALLLITPLFSYSASNLADRLKNRILLQVENNGEAWFVTDDGSRIYMGTPQAAFEILRKYALGISNKDLEKIVVSDMKVNNTIVQGYSTNNSCKSYKYTDQDYMDLYNDSIGYIDKFKDKSDELSDVCNQIINAQEKQYNTCKKDYNYCTEYKDLYYKAYKEADKTIKSLTPLIEQSKLVAEKLNECTSRLNYCLLY